MSSQLIRRAQQLTTEILMAAEVPHVKAIAQARQKAADAESAFTQANTRLRGARTAQQQVLQAAREEESVRLQLSIAHDVLVDTKKDMDEAVAAAESEQSLATQLQAQAQEDLQTAQSELASALEPVQVYLSLNAELEALTRARDGENEAYASRAFNHSSAALERAKAQHREIAAAEAAVEKTGQAYSQAQLAARQATSLNGRMQAALAASATAANKKAAGSTAQRLTAANQAEAVAAQAVATAQAALAVAMQAVQSHTVLHAAVASVLETATTADAHHRRYQVQQHLEQDRSESYVSQRDPDCTCSETSEVSCYSCRSAQERRSNEWRDNDPTR